MRDPRSRHPFPVKLTPSDERHPINLSGFLSPFWQLLNSSEKRSFEGGNCLTASKTANIMPEGSLTKDVSTNWGYLSGQADCASWQGFFGELSSGLCGAEFRMCNDGQPVACQHHRELGDCIVRTR